MGFEPFLMPNIPILQHSNIPDSMFGRLYPSGGAQKVRSSPALRDLRWAWILNYEYYQHDNSYIFDNHPWMVCPI